MDEEVSDEGTREARFEAGWYRRSGGDGGGRSRAPGSRADDCAGGAPIGRPASRGRGVVEFVEEMEKLDNREVKR
jgi:hypothetical protein